MSNESSLKSLLAWWQSIPEYRRPGHEGHFSLTSHDAESYLLALRENWASCGKAVLAICEPHREELERDARGTIQDLFAWLDVVRSKLLGAKSATEPITADVQPWQERWRESLHKLIDSPLKLAPGITFGVGPRARLLGDYRWCGDLAGEPCGVGGPLSDVPASLLPAKSDDTGCGIVAAWSALLAGFPGSVTELQFSVARSPWTAAYILNWLLSDKGVLPVSRKSPGFDGLPAVPHARPWLDQLEPVFRDWHISKFEGRKDDGLRYEEGRIKIVPNIISSPKLSAAMSQIGNPIVPSAYIVALGSPPIPTSGDNAPPLETAAGQCTVFEFLLSRLQVLAHDESATSAVPAKPPLLVVVDGSRARTFALQVGAAEQPSKLPKGAAKLLYLLGKDGRSGRVLAHCVSTLRAVPQIEPFLTTGKKVNNRYAFCSAPELRGQVHWKAKSPPAN